MLKCFGTSWLSSGCVIIQKLFLLIIYVTLANLQDVIKIFALNNTSRGKPGSWIKYLQIPRRELDPLTYSSSRAPSCTVAVVPYMHTASQNMTNLPKIRALSTNAQHVVPLVQSEFFIDKQGHEQQEALDSFSLSKFSFVSFHQLFKFIPLQH